MIRRLIVPICVCSPECTAMSWTGSLSMSGVEAVCPCAIVTSAYVSRSLFPARGRRLESFRPDTASPVSLHRSLQKTDRYPGHERDQDQSDEHRENVADDRPHSLVRIHTSYRAGCVVADAERRRKEADAHRQDDDHRVMHFVNPHLARDGKQQGPEQNDGGYALQHAAENDEGEDGNEDKRYASARKR